MPKCRKRIMIRECRRFLIRGRLTSIVLLTLLATGTVQLIMADLVAGWQMRGE
ncbi:MAG TPA: hypothetical protein VIH83_04735 [Candidatus Bathyarchaeia archaeon]